MEIGNIVTIIVAFILAAPGIFALLRQLRQDKYDREKLRSEMKKTNFEISDMLIETVPILIGPLRERIADLELQTERITELESQVTAHEKVIKIMEAQIDRLRYVNNILCNGVLELVRQLKSHGLEPVFEIDPDLSDGTEN